MRRHTLGVLAAAAADGRVLLTGPGDDVAAGNRLGVVARVPNTAMLPSGEQAAILHAQIAAVDAAKACDYLLCDTTPLVTAVYSDLLFGDQSLYPAAVAQQRRYPVTFLTGTDLPWHADGIQRDGLAARDQVDRRLREVLQIHDLPVYPVCGLGAARLASAMAALAQFHASGNPADSSPADAHAGAPA